MAASEGHRGWPSGGAPPGPAGWPGAVGPQRAGAAGHTLPGISAEAYQRQSGMRVPPAPAPAPVVDISPLTDDMEEDLHSAAELAEAEEFDREVDAEFAEEFGEDEDYDEEEDPEWDLEDEE